jgi:DNA-binding CsgD family transcriptional regulator
LAPWESPTPETPVEPEQGSVPALPSLDYMRGYLEHAGATLDPLTTGWLLGLIEETGRLRSALAVAHVPASTGNQLSVAEVRVYRMMRNTHLTIGEIAQQLYVSVNTIKTQTKSIYAKLGVQRRIELRDHPQL